MNTPSAIQRTIAKTRMSLDKLSKKGVTVRKTIDIIIGTYCIIEGLPLLHDDRDFDPMVSLLSLKVLSPK
jgi:hypothetical protein